MDTTVISHPRNAGLLLTPLPKGCHARRELYAILIIILCVILSPASSNAQARQCDSLEKVDINHASIEQLMQLSGIGKTKARAIIEERDTHGNFFDIEDLDRVKGIGNSTIQRLKDHVTISH